MSFSVAIIGFPNVGKSTLFEIITRKKVDIGEYPFTTINPNIGVVAVPDERLEKLSQVVKPQKITPAHIEFIDIAGLVKGAHKGEGLGNQFLAQVRNCDAILHVIRCFDDGKVENILREINPEKEIEIIKLELLMKDYETVENSLAKIAKDKKYKKLYDLLNKIKEGLNKGKQISEIELGEDEKLIRGYQFLTQKPVIYLLNGPRLKSDITKKYLQVDLIKLSRSIENSEETLKIGNDEKSILDQIILECYNVLELITFFTVEGGEEIRAWTLKKGGKAPEAGGIVHSEFREKFIKAEVVKWNRLISVGSWKKAKEKGLIQIVGKDYVVQEGDVIKFKI